MKAIKTIATYRRLRTEPLWRLLAADNGPVILGLLQAHMLEGERQVPASLLYDRLNRDLEILRAHGEELPQSAQAYVSDWLREGFVERRLPPGASEEVFEVTAAAAKAIRFVASLDTPHATATESRLAALMQQLVSLAEETDTNPQSRLASLETERTRLEREIDLVRAGRFRTLPEERAIERVQEIITQADELVGDFRRVRDEFQQLNRDVRARLMDDHGHRGDVLAAVFAGVDMIGDSEAGRTFNAFWRLLTEPEQSASLEGAIEQVLQRAFAHQLGPEERRFLSGLPRTLLEQGGRLQHYR